MQFEVKTIARYQAGDKNRCLWAVSQYMHNSRRYKSGLISFCGATRVKKLANNAARLEELKDTRIEWDSIRTHK